MMTIRLGEMVEKPRQQRISDLQKQIEEKKAALQARRRKEEENVKNAAKRAEMQQWNKAAYNLIQPKLAMVHQNQVDNKPIAQRLRNRTEVHLFAFSVINTIQLNLPYSQCLPKNHASVAYTY